MADTTRSVRLPSSEKVCAVAAIREDGGTVVAMQNDGSLTLVHPSGDADTTVTLPDFAIAPFSLITGDLDRDDDSTSEIVVSDSRHGLWVYKRDLTMAPGWAHEQKDWEDWPSYYRFDTTDTFEFAFLQYA